MVSNRDVNRPRVVDDEHMTFLDSLSKRVDNMFIADAILVDEFSVSLSDARLILRHWLEMKGRRQDDKQ